MPAQLAPLGSSTAAAAATAAPAETPVSAQFAPLGSSTAAAGAAAPLAEAAAVASWAASAAARAALLALPLAWTAAKRTCASVKAIFGCGSWCVSLGAAVGARIERKGCPRYDGDITCGMCPCLWGTCQLGQRRSTDTNYLCRHTKWTFRWSNPTMGGTEF